MLTLLTATGNRQKAWSICEKYMMSQDYVGPVKWVIVDDGEIPQEVTFKKENWELIIVRPFPKWKLGDNTQARNLLAGLEYINENDRLIIIEDDDRYSSDWLSHINSQLDKTDLAGECLARYYNIKSKIGRQLNNSKHASLCSTAMKGPVISYFKNVCKSNLKFIDIKLWEWKGPKHLFTGNRVVGIKGLPGRGGIGMGHKKDFQGNSDKQMDLLKSWIGKDVINYVEC